MSIYRVIFCFMLGCSVVSTTLCFPCAAWQQEESERNSSDRTTSSSSRPYRIAEETTRIVEPLDADGRIDFYKAVNEVLSHGVTPDNNAARFIYGTMPDDYFSAVETKKIRQWIDFDSLPMAFPKFTGLKEFSALDPLDRSNLESLREFVEKNKDPIDMVIKACQLPEFYFPHVPASNIYRDDSRELPFENEYEETAAGMLLNWYDGASQQIRICGRAIKSRAHLRILGQNYAEAWTDILALRQLGRLLGKRASDSEAITGSALELMAIESAMELLDHAVASGHAADLPLQEMMQEWGTDYSPYELDMKIETLRWTWLEVICVLAEDRLSFSKGLELILNTAVDIPIADEFVRQSGTTNAMSFDEGMRWGNTFFDRALEVANTNSLEERLAIYDQLYKRHSELEDRYYSSGWSIDFDRTSEENTKFICGILLINPAKRVLDMVRHHARQKRDAKVVTLTLASILYHNQKGEWPSEFDKLELATPDIYIDSLTGDTMKPVFENGRFKIRNVSPDSNYLIEFSVDQEK